MDCRGYRFREEQRTAAMLLSTAREFIKRIYRELEEIPVGLIGIENISSFSPFLPFLRYHVVSISVCS